MEEKINMEEQEWQMKLIKDPAFDSDWIAEAAKLLANGDAMITLEEIRGLDANKIKLFNEIAESETFDIDCLITLLNNKNLNATQMRLYWLGVSKGLDLVDMKTFLDPSIPYARTNFMIQALIDGHTDILKYIDYSAEQIAEIYSGMKDDIDYRVYADKKYSSDFMNLLRHALCTGMKMDIVLEDQKISINN